MPAVESNMLELGTVMPAFHLQNTNPEFGGAEVDSSSLASDEGVLIAFICNHCPFVVHIKDAFAAFAKDYTEQGLTVIAISSNDPANYPADSPEQMSRDAGSYKYQFPYLFDESQQTARDFLAACTPDFYLFNADRQLVYRGQFDDSRPGNSIPVTGNDLRCAADALLAGKPISSNQKPSIGCSIKWKSG